MPEPADEGLVVFHHGVGAHVGEWLGRRQVDRGAGHARDGQREVQRLCVHPGPDPKRDSPERSEPQHVGLGPQP